MIVKAGKSQIRSAWDRKGMTERLMTEKCWHVILLSIFGTRLGGFHSIGGVRELIRITTPGARRPASHLSVINLSVNSWA